MQIHPNQSFIQIINNIEETIHYTPQLFMGIVDIHSLGYYNVTKSIMFFDKRGNTRIPLYKVPILHLHNYYKTSQTKDFENPVGIVQFSKEIEANRSSDPYPWLDLDAPRRGMTDFLTSILIYLAQI